MKDRVVLDTNILISAILFGGKPRDVLSYIIKKEITGVASPVLLAELREVLIKKFKYPPRNLGFIEKKVRDNFIVVNPAIEIHVLKDEDDNRILEAAVTGDCQYIITGDKGFLIKKKYKKIHILTPHQFLVEVIG